MCDDEKETIEIRPRGGGKTYEFLEKRISELERKQEFYANIGHLTELDDKHLRYSYAQDNEIAELREKPCMKITEIFTKEEVERLKSWDEHHQKTLVNVQQTDMLMKLRDKIKGMSNGCSLAQQSTKEINELKEDLFQFEERIYTHGIIPRPKKVSGDKTEKKELPTRCKVCDYDFYEDCREGCNKIEASGGEKECLRNGDDGLESRKTDQPQTNSKPPEPIFNEEEFWGDEPREDLYTCRLCGNEITLVEHEVSKLTREVKREDLDKLIISCKNIWLSKRIKEENKITKP